MRIERLSVLLLSSSTHRFQSKIRRIVPVGPGAGHDDSKGYLWEAKPETH